jgi:hypothetical protein
MPRESVFFLAASKLALGNFQRVTNVAAALRISRPDLPLSLMTNSERGADWARTTRVYEEVIVDDRSRAAARLRDSVPRAVVVSTMVVPAIETVAAPLCLILREVLPAKVDGFRLPNGRLWDMVVVPNPAHEWLPDADVLGARRVEAVGWIYRTPAPPPRAQGGLEPATDRRPQVLVTAGGGSGDDEHDALTSEIARLIARLRVRSAVGFDVVHARGPNARPGWTIPGVDRTLEPGPDLHNQFARADLIISTAGYNSVLELACTDVPVLLTPIGRYSDDQYKRARDWGVRLGLCHDANAIDRSVDWAADILDRRIRRSPVDLGPSGAAACAALIAGLVR